MTTEELILHEFKKLNEKMDTVCGLLEDIQWSSSTTEQEVTGLKEKINEIKKILMDG